jgi:hypothetical protein
MEAKELGASVILAFKAPRTLAEAAQRAADAEGITGSDVVRRAVMRDLRANGGLGEGAAP